MVKQTLMRKGISLAVAGSFLALTNPLAFAQSSMDTCPSGMTGCPSQQMLPGEQPTSYQTQGSSYINQNAPSTVVIPSGTAFNIQSSSMGPLTTGSAFTGTIRDAVMVNGINVIPAGSTVSGTVTAVDATGANGNVMLQNVNTTTGETIALRTCARVSQLQGGVQTTTVQGQTTTTGERTFFPTVTWGNEQRLSPGGKVVAGTLGGATFGAATGTLTGLINSAVYDETSEGTGAVRGLWIGSAVGAGLGLITGVVAAATTRDRTAVTTTTVPRTAMGPTNITTGSLEEVPVSYTTPATAGMNEYQAVLQNDVVIQR